MNNIAAIAVTLEKALPPDFKDSIAAQVLKERAGSGDGLRAGRSADRTGGTDNT